MTAPAFDETRAAELRSWYAAHQYKCEVFRQKLDLLLRTELDRQSILNARLVSRTKTIDSFVQKAMKSTRGVERTSTTTRLYK